MAVEGYWRNWERSTAWLMREVVFAMISGNLYIKSNKPSNPKEIFRISDDKQGPDKESRKVSPEELEEAKQLLMSIRDNKNK